MVLETKIGNAFAESQFSIECFSTPYRLDETTKGREVLFYIRQDIPSNYFKKITVNDESFERFFVQLNLRSKKWFLGYSYNPHKETITSHLRKLSTALEKLCANYKNMIILGNLKVEVEEKNMSKFLSVSLLKKSPYSGLFWSASLPHFSYIQTEYGKMRTTITSNADTFYAVHIA